MIPYQLTNGPTVIKDGVIHISLLDTAEYPNTNEYYLEYQEWCKAGGVPLPPLVDVDELKEKLRVDLSEHYEERMKIISLAYPPSERESWSVQTEEAKAMLLDSTVSTPWINAASDACGIDRLVLANRIVAKDTAYRSIHGHLTGVRQKIEDQIHEAGNDIVALQAIDIKNGWPDLSDL